MPLGMFPADFCMYQATYAQYLLCCSSLMQICLKFSFASSWPCIAVIIPFSIEPMYFTLIYWVNVGTLFKALAMALCICKPKGQALTTKASSTGLSTFARVTGVFVVVSAVWLFLY